LAQQLTDATRTDRLDRNATSVDGNGTHPEADVEAAFVPLITEGDRRIATLRTERKPRVFIVSGPSGVGKDAVIERLQVRYPHARYVVTATTRPVRPGEIDGVHYHFLDENEFLTRLGANDFLEHAIVYGNHYGVPRSPVAEALRQGQDVVIKVDVKGAATLRERISHTVSIFLAPESMDELRHRLRSRKTEDPEVLFKRFATAAHELTRAYEFDFVVFNESGKLETALDTLCRIIESEHHRLHQLAVEVN
jgi:guanylate kinase